MSTKTMILFPYGGYKNQKCEEFFWKTVKTCQEIDKIPIVVLNRDTEIRGQAASFLEDPRTTSVAILRVWSVDTCQMWLAGWGYIIDNYKKNSRIVQLPGDIETVGETEEAKARFLGNMKNLIQARHSDIIIGDFDTGDRYSAKELIDTYGTYSLLANWFPEVSRNVQALPLHRPRSEFLNVKVSVLSKLLKYSKFAYEQTLNMLIRSWNFTNHKWQYKISVQDLGTLQDDKTFRQYRGCLNQIERTERLLKFLWREINEPRPTQDPLKDEKRYKEFSDE